MTCTSAGRRCSRTWPGWRATSTGTPQPDGPTWRQAVEVIRAVASAPQGNLISADVVEFVPSARPPGCDLIVAKLAAKVLAFRFAQPPRRGIQD